MRRSDELLREVILELKQALQKKEVEAHGSAPAEVMQDDERNTS